MWNYTLKEKAIKNIRFLKNTNKVFSSLFLYIS